MKKSYYLCFAIFTAIAVLSIFYPEIVMANKLEEAAEESKSIVVTVAQILAPIGVIGGGALMSIGNSNLGKRVLMGGVVGSALVYGGPSIIDLIKNIFS